MVNVQEAVLHMHLNGKLVRVRIYCDSEEKKWNDYDCCDAVMLNLEVTDTLIHGKISARKVGILIK